VRWRDPSYKVKRLVVFNSSGVKLLSSSSTAR
jgi:hypothetical protein